MTNIASWQIIMHMLTAWVVAAEKDLMLLMQPFHVYSLLVGEKMPNQGLQRPNRQVSLVSALCN